MEHPPLPQLLAQRPWFGWLKTSQPPPGCHHPQLPGFLLAADPCCVRWRFHLSFGLGVVLCRTDSFLQIWQNDSRSCNCNCYSRYSFCALHSTCKSSHTPSKLPCIRCFCLKNVFQLAGWKSWRLKTKALLWPPHLATAPGLTPNQNSMEPPWWHTVIQLKK